MSSDYDGIILGTGHNALVLQAYLGAAACASEPGPCLGTRRWAGHGGEPPPSRVPAQYPFLLPPGRHHDALVPRPGAAPPRGRVSRARAQRRPDPARRAVSSVVDRVRQNCGLVCGIFPTGCGRLTALGRGVPADRRADHPARGAIATVAAPAANRAARCVGPGAAVLGDLGGAHRWSLSRRNSSTMWSAPDSCSSTA